MTESTNVDIDNADDSNLDISEGQAKKLSPIARFKAFLANRKQTQDAEQDPDPAVKMSKKTTAEDIRKINDFLGSIEHQLDKVDLQNKTLLEQINILKANNDALLERIQTLTDNNNQLTEQFRNMKRREKIAKTLAIISAILAIGLSLYNILRLIFDFTLFG